MKKIIAHVDMDAFFAAIEERDKPWLSGFPIVVGADPRGGSERGVVSTANYKARQYGIRSALPISRAWCYSEEARKRGETAAVFLTSNFKAYSKASQKIFECIKKYTSIIQVTSIDEAYLDLSYTRSFREAAIIAQKIKREIKKEIKLTCSIGVGPNKMIAKIASDFQKPDGLTVVIEKDVLAFLAPLSVRAISGVGPKTEMILRGMRIKTIADLTKLSRLTLEQRFGSHGQSLYDKARGIGETELTLKREIKSIGEHETFMTDTLDFDFILKRLSTLASGIITAMQRKGFSGFRTVVATVRFADFETKTRSLTTRESISSRKMLESRALKLILPFFEKTENPGQKQIRMIGLRIEKLV